MAFFFGSTWGFQVVVACLCLLGALDGLDTLAPLSFMSSAPANSSVGVPLSSKSFLISLVGGTHTAAVGSGCSELPLVFELLAGVVDKVELVFDTAMMEESGREEDAGATRPESKVGVGIRGGATSTEVESNKVVGVGTSAVDLEGRARVGASGMAHIKEITGTLLEVVMVSASTM
ncbi:hypothetical protein BU15DRAFT_67621 [Melanogaster broomeanus]|nr:hypothetical protein BU15DRAFT_67621 [Melanogaster broomeanus]